MGVLRKKRKKRQKRPLWDNKFLWVLILLSSVCTHTVHRLHATQLFFPSLDENSPGMLLFSGGWFLRIYCEYMHYICAHQNTAGAVNDPGVHKHGYFLIWFKFMQGSNCYTALAEQRPNLTGDKGAFHRVSHKEEFKGDDRLFITSLVPWGSDLWWCSQELMQKKHPEHPAWLWREQKQL